MYDKTSLPKSREFYTFTRLWHYSTKQAISWCIEKTSSLDKKLLEM